MERNGVKWAGFFNEILVVRPPRAHEGARLGVVIAQAHAFAPGVVPH
jgi:hypothetical protein